LPTPTPTARGCLLYLASNPGASNREVANGVGIRHQEQVSKLLARLHACGLLAKRAATPGAANAWWLTPHGQLVAAALRDGRPGRSGWERLAGTN
jgi:hypothetical protein